MKLMNVNKIKISYYNSRRHVFYIQKQPDYLKGMGLVKDYKDLKIKIISDYSPPSLIGTNQHYIHFHLRKPMSRWSDTKFIKTTKEKYQIIKKAIDRLNKELVNRKIY